MALGDSDLLCAAVSPASAFFPAGQPYAGAANFTPLMAKV